jgi:thioredoxin-like negative regulator of GroEL
MFTPPFKDASGKPLYPEMTRNAILFGGTDPGRFCPTYMIFCESFIPPEKRRDPKFDRRDVYIITQNALADATYLSYIRAHYNRSTQKDPPFFQELFKSSMFEGLDNFFTSYGAKVEARRRAEGVYPPVEINTPTLEDSRATFDEYMTDFQRRMQANQLKPGEDFRIVDNKIQVSGQASVMQINGLLTKIIFDRNPTNEFFVEESFPLDWMYPYLTPFGIIMKINRQPLAELSDEVVKKDHEFWSQYSSRLCGNFITYDTPVKEICDFVERVYLRGDFKGYKGDPKFVRDNDAQKAFSKLRSALAGLYAWRVNQSKSVAEQQRMIKEADFAFKQAFAFCPFSPEALFRYVNLLASMNRIDDAIALAETCHKFDPENRGVRDLAGQLQQMKQAGPGAGAGAPPPANQVAVLEQQYKADPSNLVLAMNLLGAYTQSQMNAQAEALLAQVLPALEEQVNKSTSNMQLTFGLVSIYIQKKQTIKALALLDKIGDDPKSDPTMLLNTAQGYAQLGVADKLEGTLQKLVVKMPESPEAWYDLSAVQVSVGKTNEALKSLSSAIKLSDQRRAKDPKAKDLAQMASKDGRYLILQGVPEFKALIQGH